MFDELKKQIRALEGELEVEVEVPTDEKGYSDRQCPAANCRFLFKVHQEDWRNRFREEAVYCPLCRNEARADKWWTAEQTDYLMRSAEVEARRRLAGALERGVSGFNRAQPRTGFIKMSMSLDPPALPVVFPISAMDALELEITCDECGARFAVLGAAFFCPACGHNSVERTFDDSIRKVTVKLDSIAAIRGAVGAHAGKDAAELTVRSMIESGIQDCVVAFQRLAEELYGRVSSSAPPRRNAFQNLDERGALWTSVLGQGYENWLTPDEYRELSVVFQQRHLLAHREGIVDAEYLAKTGDTCYTEGQRIVIRANDVRRMTELVSRLAGELRSRA